MNPIATIKKTIEDATTIGIVSHIHADGDCLGSQLGLKMALENIGKKVCCYNVGNMPAAYSFIEGYDTIQSFPKIHDWPQLIIAVDCGSLDRIGLSELPENTTVINIDHHTGNTRYGHINWIDEAAPATCQMIADLLLAWPLEITAPIATALLTGISTDTGSFKYHQTSAHTFKTAALLREAGADLDLIRLHVYESMNRGQFEVMQHIFSKARFYGDGQIIVSGIDYATISAMNPGETSYSGVVAQLKEIDGVEVAVLLRELNDGAIKVSLRSKTFFDVNAFAEPFGGGGHIRAAGLILRSSLKESEKDIVQALETALESEVRHLQ